MSAYKPSEARYDRGGRVLYLVYQSPQRLANGKLRGRTRVKRLYFPADSADITVSKPGEREKRTGRKVYGVEVRYRNRQDGRRRTTTVQRSKIVELPQGAKDIQLTEKPPKGPLMAVA